MKKIFKVVILAAIAAACAAIAACAGEPGPEEQGKPNVFWDEVSGAENYDIYAAASRFGAYTLLASGLERCEYFDPGYSFENYYKVEAVAGGETVGVQLVGGEAELFGENVYILSPKDDPVEVQALIDDLYEQQEEAHFTSRRYAVFFKPGNYADGIDLSVGYYTTFAGLGRKTEAVSVMRMRCTDT